MKRLIGLLSLVFVLGVAALYSNSINKGPAGFFVSGLRPVELSRCFVVAIRPPGKSRTIKELESLPAVNDGVSAPGGSL